MRESIDEYARLSRRIADVKSRIAEGQERLVPDGLPWDAPVRTEILELLKTTLRDLEARIAALQSADQEQAKKSAVPPRSS
jgi:hypothetical protein